MIIVGTELLEIAWHLRRHGNEIGIPLENDENWPEHSPHMGESLLLCNGRLRVPLFLLAVLSVEIVAVLGVGTEKSRQLPDAFRLRFKNPCILRKLQLLQTAFLRRLQKSHHHVFFLRIGDEILKNQRRRSFFAEIKAQLVQKIERIGMMDHPKMRQVIDALEDGTLKLHDISTRIQAEKPVMHRNTKNTSADPNIGQKKIVDMPDMNQISIQSIDGQFNFVVCENEFLIGKSRE